MSFNLPNIFRRSTISHAIVFTLLLALFTYTSHSTPADPSSWRLIKEEAEIKIYTRPLPDQPIDEIKATTRIKGSVASWLTLFEDENRAPDWLYHCLKAKTLAKGDDWITTYMETDFPWPLKDRYSIIRSEYIWDKENQGIQIVGKTHQIDLQQRNHLVRVPMAKNHWQVYSLADGYIEVTVLAQVDPGGIIPKWMVNYATANGPYYSLLKMRRILESESFKTNENLH